MNLGSKKGSHYQHWLREAASSSVAQIWPWGSQMTDETKPNQIRKN